MNIPLPFINFDFSVATPYLQLYLKLEPDERVPQIPVGFGVGKSVTDLIAVLMVPNTLDMGKAL
jgi:hypothetical protein